MMKMLIQLDEERVVKDGKYKLEDMWRVIDAKFDKYDCVKEIQPDGSILYTGNPEKDYYTCMALANITLKKQKWFGKYCKKWIMLDNEDDETLPLQNIDILARQRQTNPYLRCKDGKNETKSIELRS